MSASNPTPAEPRNNSNSNSNSNINARIVAKPRFLCEWEGCGKSFARKEHLSRHVRGHGDGGVGGVGSIGVERGAGAKSNVCAVCLREFNRSDSLQRHMLRHGSQYKQTPSGRSKKACVSCRSNKVKCDGNEMCSRCEKKGIECVYKRDNTEDRENRGKSSDREMDTLPEPAIEPAVSGDSPSSNVPALNSLQPQVVDFNELSRSENMDDVRSNVRFPVLNNASAPSLSTIQWVLSSKIQKEAPNKEQIKDVDCPLPESQMESYTMLYFKHFHHRWTIIHYPTWEADGHTVLTSSIYMIGAWLDGTDDARKLALSEHKRLMTLIGSRLTEVSSKYVLQQSLSIILCQAALLNIVFSLYCGQEELLSKGIVMSATLVSVLREVGFFNPDIPYDKPMALYAFRLVSTGERQRLASYLFKINSYFEMIRNRPAALSVDELHYSLPATYSLHNANGLHVLNPRLSVEPPRDQISVRGLIQAAELSPTDRTSGIVLLEDIQSGLCSMHAKLVARNSLDREVLKQRMILWKELILRPPFQMFDNLNPTQQKVMRYYYGDEDRSVAGWQEIVFARPRDLYFDTLILYHLMNLQLHSNMKTLRQISEDACTDYSAYGIPYLNARYKRELESKAWAHGTDGREALCHAIQIHTMLRNLSQEEKATVDPIAYVSISVAALIVWGYCTFSEHTCELPTELKHPTLPSYELTSWYQQNSADREAWVATGCGNVVVDGTLVCLCNKNILLGKLKPCLPKQWEVSQSIASGIF